MTYHSHDGATKYMEKNKKVLKKEKLVSIEKVATDIWDLLECLKCYKAIMQQEGKTAHIYTNVSTGSKIARKDPLDRLSDEKVISTAQLPIYSVDIPSIKII